jgi:hypothetical protein
MLAHRWTRWVAYLISWTLVGLFFASQTYLAYKYSGGSPHLGVILKFSLSEWYIWALLAPGVMGLARNYRWSAVVAGATSFKTRPTPRLSLTWTVSQDVGFFPGVVEHIISDGCVVEKFGNFGGSACRIHFSIV